MDGEEEEESIFCQVESFFQNPTYICLVFFKDEIWYLIFR